jgi:hypothetical protein
MSVSAGWQLAKALFMQLNWIRLVSLSPLIVCLAACATIAPYERERLAKNDMQFDKSADASAGANHATAYREGSSGAEGASGGGCGCN